MKPLFRACFVGPSVAWPLWSPSRVRPFVVLSQPNAVISILTPVTDALSCCDAIGAPLSCKNVTMETENNADPSPPANSSLNRGFRRN